MNLGELIVGNPQAGCVSAVVKGAANRQSGFGTGRCDQLDDDLMGDKWLATPVLRHEREEPVFDLVPLACAWRQVAEAYRDAEFALTLTLTLHRAPASCGQLRCRLGHCSAVFWGSFRRWTVIVSPSLWSPRLFWRCSPDLSVGFRVFARTQRCSHRQTGWRDERSAPIRGERATAATRVTCARARVA